MQTVLLCIPSNTFTIMLFLIVKTRYLFVSILLSHVYWLTSANLMKGHDGYAYYSHKLQATTRSQITSIVYTS